MRSHSLLLNDTISWILLSKKFLLVNFTIFLYLIQSLLCLDIWYTAKSLLHSLFHHAWDCLVMLTIFENLFQKFSTIVANSWVILSSISQLVILVISIAPNLFLSSLTNYFSSLLFLMMNCLFFWINSFFMIIKTHNRA